MRGVLIDLDGVIYQGDALLPGARESIDWLTREAIPHLYLTNTTSKPRGAIVQKLQALGIAADAEQVWTPVAAAKTYLSNGAPGAVHSLLVPDTAAELTANASPDAPLRAVVVGDLGASWSFAALNDAFNLLQAHPDQLQP